MSTRSVRSSRMVSRVSDAAAATAAFSLPLPSAVPLPAAAAASDRETPARCTAPSYRPRPGLDDAPISFG